MVTGNETERKQEKQGQAGAAVAFFLPGVSRWVLVKCIACAVVPSV